MSDFFADQDPSSSGRGGVRRPPDQVRIQKLEAVLHPDGVRLRLRLSLTPFLERPNGSIAVFNSRDEELASVAFIEAMSPRMEFTLHLRGELLPPYHARAEIYYEKPTGEPTTGEAPQEVEKIVVHQLEIAI